MPFRLCGSSTQVNHKGHEVFLIYPVKTGFVCAHRALAREVNGFTVCGGDNYDRPDHNQPTNSRHMSARHDAPSALGSVHCRITGKAYRENERI